jgi:TonB family protein
VKRYLIASLIFHVAVVVAGAAVAPMSGYLDRQVRTPFVINVGLVEMPQQEPSRVAAPPRPRLPTPAGDVEVALKPAPHLQKEEVTEEEKPEPKKPEDEKPTEEETAKQAEKDKADSAAAAGLAVGDTVSPAQGVIMEGGRMDDVWGVDVSPTVNPYHRRGFAAIRANWRNPAVGPQPRRCVVRFRVKRSGEITNIGLEESSGSTLFDRAAVRAVQVTEVWEEFPKLWKEDEQIILLEFEYRP